MHSYTENSGKYYYTVFDLEKRGWTKTSINKFLGKCDQLLSVNHYANFHGKNAYLKDRVNEKEQTELFKLFFIKSAKRRKLKKAYIEKVINEVIHNNYEPKESDLYYEKFEDNSSEDDHDRIITGVAYLMKIMHCKYCQSPETEPASNSMRFCRTCKKEYIYESD